MLNIIKRRLLICITPDAMHSLSVRHFQVSMEANLTAIVLLHHDDGLGDRRKYFDHDDIRHKQAL